jgi:hypothetical protein
MVICQVRGGVQGGLRFHLKSTDYCSACAGDFQDKISNNDSVVLIGLATEFDFSEGKQLFLTLDLESHPSVRCASTKTSFVLVWSGEQC